MELTDKSDFTQKLENLKARYNFIFKKNSTEIETTQNDCLRIEWKNIDNQICLYFTFKGMFTYESSLKSVEEWKSRFSDKEQLKFIVVWNCLEMTGYEPGARMLWQKTLQDLKSQIEVIWLISNSSLIKAGAKILSLSTSYNVKTVSSEAEIHQI
ncbi:MAG: hypothetical protein CMO01_30720 [Thalassobius sp.]|nr:hypothetical protein [Thalassovita sp.]